MKTIQFFGAAGEVTGSSYLVTGNQGGKLLVDLGMFQGVASHPANFFPLTYGPKTLSAVLLTHAHLDHCGRLPLLIKYGFRGKIFTTEATKMITSVSLLDSAQVIKQENQGPALYTADDVEKTVNQIETASYDQPFSVDEFTIIFRDAGHILGSASIEIEERNRVPQTVVFSGDLGNSPQDLILPTHYIKEATTVVMESTYGDSTHPEEDVPAILEQEIKTVEHSKGVLIIPAFSIERTQEVLHKIGHLRINGAIGAATPVFLDSPMAIEVTEIFKNFPNLYNPELSADIHPFDFPGLVRTRTVDESKWILKHDGTKIIIAGSGMMMGGRIMYHLKNYISLPTTCVLIVGYQAVGTLGRAIEEGARSVTIHDEHVAVRATIRKLGSLSSHADQPKLLQWLRSISGVRQVFLVHGDNRQRSALAEKIKAELRIQNVILPIQDQVCQVKMSS